jgi:hypothetical protein
MKNKKLLIIFFLAAFWLIPGLSFAQPDANDMLWGGYEDDFQETTGLGDKDPREMIASLLNIALGFLGIISLLIIMLAGLKWMLSMGNEDKTSEAKRMLSGGIIGLIIIAGSFGLARFIIEAIYNATN